MYLTFSYRCFSIMMFIVMLKYIPSTVNTYSMLEVIIFFYDSNIQYA